jgi:hypothetical protein
MVHHHQQEYRAKPSHSSGSNRHVRISVPPPPLVRIKIDDRSPRHALGVSGHLVNSFLVPASLRREPSPPGLSEQQHYRVPRPSPQYFHSRPPDPGVKVIPKVHAIRRGHIHVEMPMRRVHFELPPQVGEARRQVRREPSSSDLRRVSMPARSALKRDRSRPDLYQQHVPVRLHVHRNPSHHNLRRQPSQQNLSRRRSDRNLRQQHSSARPTTVLAKATHPTIHILTFARQSAPHTADAEDIITNNLPPGTPHLYTIRAYNFAPPPAHLCAVYSGASSIIQDYVMRDPQARKAVRSAVHDLLEFGKREKRREREGRSWKREVAISVCCESGTHRSVGVAERIREDFMEVVGRMGVRIRVVHMHRRRGVGDPW